MLDIRKAESEAAEYGISLREWMQLRNYAYGNIEPPENSERADEYVKEEKWRARVADTLIANDLVSKARHYLECSRFAIRFECQGPDHHKLFSPVYCDLRFCPRCARRQYARLLEKYLPIIAAIAKKPHRGFAFREITLTTKNTGTFTSEQVLEFNRDVKKTLKILMKGVSGWGALLCDEVGYNNTNLHAHILFWGPYITQPDLASAWQEVSGNSVVYIRKAHARGALALRHLLKYVSKPPADNPELIGMLETAFHKRRRVHAMGLFYDFAGKDMDNEYSAWSDCPKCGAKLTRIPGAVSIQEAILAGCTFVGSGRIERKSEWVN